MKREIKFRGWDGAQMYYDPDDFYLKINGECFDIFEGEMDEPICGQLTLMQFTGLKDKNGKEIYEGDIVKHKWRDGDIQITRIVWKDGGFTYENTSYDYDGMLYAEEWEVIGNIYETPELLK